MIQNHGRVQLIDHGIKTLFLQGKSQKGRGHDSDPHTGITKLSCNLPLHCNHSFIADKAKSVEMMAEE